MTLFLTKPPFLNEVASNQRENTEEQEGERSLMLPTHAPTPSFSRWPPGTSFPQPCFPNLSPPTRTFSPLSRIISAAFDTPCLLRFWSKRGPSRFPRLLPHYPPHSFPAERDLRFAARVTCTGDPAAAAPAGRAEDLVPMSCRLKLSPCRRLLADAAPKERKE